MGLTLSTKYAMLALEELVRRGGSSSVQDLATATNIPPAYLGKLVPLLVRVGILYTQRGRGGGVFLARAPENIPLKEIIEAVEGPTALQDCPFEVTPCEGNPQCPLYPVWDPLRDRIVGFLARTSLAEVVERLAPQRKEEGK